VPNVESSCLFFRVTSGFDVNVSEAVNVIVTVPVFVGSGTVIIELNVGDGFGHPTVNNG